MRGLPALGFEVAHVDVTALFDCADHFSDIFAVFDSGIARLEVNQCNLVTYGNIGFCSEPEGGVVLCDDTEHISPGLEPFDDDNANVVFGAVDE
jgi:hypothetical protein